MSHYCHTQGHSKQTGSLNGTGNFTSSGMQSPAKDYSPQIESFADRIFYRELIIPRKLTDTKR
jgi:hypothetical protein